MIHIGLLLGLSHGFPSGKGVSCGSDVHTVAGGIEKSCEDVWPKKWGNKLPRSTQWLLTIMFSLELPGYICSKVCTMYIDFAILDKCNWNRSHRENCNPAPKNGRWDCSFSSSIGLQQVLLNAGGARSAEDLPSTGRHWWHEPYRAMSMFLRCEKNAVGAPHWNTYM